MRGNKYAETEYAVTDRIAGALKDDDSTVMGINATIEEMLPRTRVATA